MKQDYRLSDKLVSMEVAEGVVAVKIGRPAIKSKDYPRTDTDQSGSRHPENTQGECSTILPSRSVRSFVKEGWLFLDPRQAKILRLPARRVLLRPTVHNNSQTMFVETDLVTVKLNANIREREVKEQLRADNLKMIRRLGFAPNTFEAQISPTKTLSEEVGRLQRNDRYRFVEPVLLQDLSRRMSLNDTGFDHQWQHREKSEVNGVIQAGINSEEAWKITRGRNYRRPIRIAIIDAGMQVDHPNLKGGIIGGGRFITKKTEADYKFDPYRPGDHDFTDDDHGTFCMGMAGARRISECGVRGAAPESDLIAIACGPNRIVSQTVLARAIAYAADPSLEDQTASSDQGADIIACSLGPDYDEHWDMCSVLSEAITFASEKGRNGRGALIFWAVSNNYYPIEDDKVCSHAKVIAVGTSNRYDRSDGSAYGEKLDFLAPGANVYSTKSGSRYGSGSGTSFAAPLAAGVAALVLARHPDWTRDQVLGRLRESCDKIGDVSYDDNGQGRNNDYGYGRINAAKAVGVGLEQRQQVAHTVIAILANLFFAIRLALIGR
jgi:subtilase family protein